MRLFWRALTLALVAGCLCPAPGRAQNLVVETDLLLDPRPGTVPGPAVIVIRDGLVRSVTSGQSGSAASDVPAGTPRLFAAAVLPGLVDARTTLGLAGLHPADDDEDEAGGPVRPELRAADGFDFREPLLVQALRGGVTVVHSGPGPANSIGGQTGVFRTYRSGAGDGIIREPAALVLSLTEDVRDAYAARNLLPTTRMANVALIRQAFLDAEHREGSADPPSSPADVAMEAARSGRLPVFIQAHRSDEIAGALRIAREFGLEAVVVGGREAALVVELLGREGVPVVLTPPGEALALAREPDEVLGAAVALRTRGIPFALASGERGPGLLLLDWAVDAARHGLEPGEALAAVTLHPARLLGIHDRWGTVEAGKMGDLVLLDGNPFAGPWRVEAVVVGGEVAFRRRD